MTSLEWVKVKKRLSDRENAISRTLAGVPDGPKYVVVPDADEDSGKRKEATYRGALCEQLAEIQERRKSMRPARSRRW